MKRKEIKKKSKTNRKYDTGKYFHDVIIVVVQSTLPSPLGRRGLG
jgi:hypothetical protein